MTLARLYVLFFVSGLKSRAFYLPKTEVRLNIKSFLMDDVAMDRAISRIAHEIPERNRGLEDVALVGIQRRGVPLAHRLRERIKDFEGVEVDMGILDITFYRDDLSLLSSHPIVKETNLPFNINGKTIILVDDVLFTGRTCRAAIEAVFDMGRPEKIQLAVLIDRGHRELPIKPDYIGKNVPTSRRETIHVEVMEIDGQNRVYLTEQTDETSAE